MKTTIAACAAVLLLSACGAGQDDEVRDNIKAELSSNAADLGTGGELDDEQAGCIAEGIVDGVGVTKLKAYGIVADDNTVDSSITDVELDTEDADAMASAIVDCVDFAELFDDQLGGVLGGLPEDARTCFEEAFTEENFKKMLSAQLAGETDTDGLTESLTECVTP